MAYSGFSARPRRLTAPEPERVAVYAIAAYIGLRMVDQLHADDGSRHALANLLDQVVGNTQRVARNDDGGGVANVERRIGRSGPHRALGRASSRGVLIDHLAG